MPDRARGARDRDRLIRWERVQLILDARVPAGAAVDPADARARRATAAGGRADGRRPTPPSTAIASTIRFNVMQGPGSAARRPGRWTLRRSAVVPVRRPGRHRSARDAGVFPLDAGPVPRDPGRRTGDGAIASPSTSTFDDPTRRVDRRRRERAAAPRRRSDPSARRPSGAGRRSSRLVRRAGPAAHPVHLATHRGADRQPPGRPRPDGRARPRPRVRPADPVQARHHQRRSLRDRLRLPWLLARADVIVIDDFQPVIYRIGLDPDVRIVQLWHASGAFKTVGYSRVGKPGGPDP